MHSNNVVATTSDLSGLSLTQRGKVMAITLSVGETIRWMANSLYQELKQMEG